AAGVVRGGDEDAQVATHVAAGDGVGLTAGDRREGAGRRRAALPLVAVAGRAAAPDPGRRGQRLAGLCGAADRRWGRIGRRCAAAAERVGDGEFGGGVGAVVGGGDLDEVVAAGGGAVEAEAQSGG